MHVRAELLRNGQTLVCGDSSEVTPVGRDEYLLVHYRAVKRGQVVSSMIAPAILQ
jgi:hypothetical protein